MGQRGILDRVPLAHTSSVTSLDWCSQATKSGPSATDRQGMGWFVSGSLDRQVKVWDLSSQDSGTHISNKPTYTLYPSFPVRRVVWRPNYACELAVVSNSRFSSGSNLDTNTCIDENSPTSIAGGADAVEIWDVRRSWIPKWTVPGLAGEGSLTDLTYGDADSIWTQHFSGTFSQTDLRTCVKPIDSVNPTAISWSESGSITFALDVEDPNQIPYDDIASEMRSIAARYQVKPKVLGDPIFMPLSQDIGTYQDDGNDAHNAFRRLARGYVFHGRDRPTLCVANAHVAHEASKDNIAQMWLLLATSLSDLISEPRPPQEQIVCDTKSSSALSSTGNYPYYYLPSSSTSPAYLRKSSPGNRTASVCPQRNSSASRSLKITPASSSTSSPRQISIPLPSHSATVHRRPSFLNARDFADSELARRVTTSLYRRPSVCIPGLHSMSPVSGRIASGSGDAPGTSGSASLRHVGEGALDDSDTSVSGSEDGNGDDGLIPTTSSAISPLLLPNRGIPTPSPLSRVAEQCQWSEDESKDTMLKGSLSCDGDGEDADVEDEESSSPSPTSTDTESVKSRISPFRPPSEFSGNYMKTGQLKHRISSKVDSDSRSSTVASLAAKPVSLPLLPPLVHQDSQSSVHTVIAGQTNLLGVGSKESSVPAPAGASTGVVPYLHENDEEKRKIFAASDSGINRPPSLDVTDGAGNGRNTNGVLGEHFQQPLVAVDLSLLKNRRYELVLADEKRFRDLTWMVLQEALETLANEGDVQTCAMFALIAPEELKIPKHRVDCFLESYLDILMRRRLHVCAAYLRKYCRVETVRSITKVETTIYSSCGSCRKPIMIPIGTYTGARPLLGGYGFCLHCRRSSSLCTICRLPVRKLYTQCSACNHGGHWACYKNFFARVATMKINSSYPVSNTVLKPTTDSTTRMSRLTSLCTSADDNEGARDCDLYGTGYSRVQSADLYPDTVRTIPSVYPSSICKQLEFTAPYNDPETCNRSKKESGGYLCLAGCGHICRDINIQKKNEIMISVVNDST